MIVEQIWTANKARNFNYLVACEEMGEAAAIDPIDYQRCLAIADRRGWRITRIINTHEHSDHISGNSEIVKTTGAQLLAPANAGAKIRDVDRGLQHHDLVTIGTSVRLKVLETPGHTISHVALISTTPAPVLFSGDVLFNAGVGNCHNGGDPDLLFDTIETKIQNLPDEVRVYPGHEYLINNLNFSLDRKPDNKKVRELLAILGDAYDPSQPLETTLGLEREINPFLRLGSETLVQRLRDSFPDMPESRRDVFLRLRQLRDRW